jgi:hypothetical protein
MPALVRMKFSNFLSKQLKEKRLKCQLKHAVHLLEIRCQEINA